MRKILAIVLALMLVLSMIVSASAITVGSWGETNYGYKAPQQEETEEQPVYDWADWFYRWFDLFR